jgi:hypothetical protein
MSTLTETQLQYNGFPYTVQEVEATWNAKEGRFSHDYPKDMLKGAWSLNQRYTTIGSAKRGLKHVTEIDNAGFSGHARFVISVLKYTGRPGHKDRFDVTLHCFE